MAIILCLRLQRKSRIELCVKIETNIVFWEMMEHVF